MNVALQSSLTNATTCAARLGEPCVVVKFESSLNYFVNTKAEHEKAEHPKANVLVVVLPDGTEVWS